MDKKLYSKIAKDIAQAQYDGGMGGSTRSWMGEIIILAKCAEKPYVKVQRDIEKMTEYYHDEFYRGIKVEKPLILG